MKKTKVLSLLLAVFLLLSSLTLPLLAVDAETAEDPEQTQSDGADAAAADDSVPEDQLRQAARLAVCKINIDSDLRLAMTGTIRKYLAEHPAEFDPRKYLGPARENIKQLVKHKIVDVLGCDGKA